MHQDRKPTVPGIVQKPKKSMSHKEQSPCQLDLTTAKGLTLARVRIPFPPTGAAGGAAAREFPWGLSPSWYVTIPVHTNQCTPGLHPGAMLLRRLQGPSLLSSGIKVKHPGPALRGFQPSPTCYSRFLSISHRCTPYTVATLFSAPQPCEHLSTELHPLCPF